MKSSDGTAACEAQAVSPRTAALGACALAAVGFALAGATSNLDAPTPTPPSLAPAHAECAERERPLVHAAELESRARGKMARYPFAPADGVPALDLLAEAARCRERAGDATGAQRVRDRQEVWLARLERDCRDHRLRLARARESSRQADARVEVAALRALLFARDGAYTAWLRRLALELEDAERVSEEP